MREDFVALKRSSTTDQITATPTVTGTTKCLTTWPTACCGLTGQPRSLFIPTLRRSCHRILCMAPKIQGLGILACLVKVCHSHAWSSCVSRRHRCSLGWFTACSSSERRSFKQSSMLSLVDGRRVHTPIVRASSQRQSRTSEEHVSVESSRYEDEDEPT